LVIAGQLADVSLRIEGKDHDESTENDCAAHPQAFRGLAVRTRGADCKEENEKAISKEDDRP